MDKKEQIGVITEQGYVAGSFGFDPVSEQEAAKIKEDEKKDNDDTK